MAKKKEWVEKEGCRIVPRNCSLTAFSDALKGMEPGAIMDLDLARILNAVAVVGTPANLAKLRQVAEWSEPFRLLMEKAEVMGLSDAAKTWLVSGEQGVSSQTMFSSVLNFPLLTTDRYGAPHDPADFRRCRLLVEAVPEIKANLAGCAGLSPAWKEIVEQWDVLCSTMDAESPEWRLGRGGSAPLTYKMFQDIEDGARAGAAGRPKF